MRTYTQGDTLRVTEFKDLGADNAFLFREFVNAALTDAIRVVEVDLGAADYVDSEGLGALIWAHKQVCPRQGKVRLLNPRPMVRAFFQMLKLDGVFETQAS